MTDTASVEVPGTVSGGVKTLLRLEGLVLFAGNDALYALWAGPWWLYAVLFFAPDLSFMAYLAGPKIGAWAYNAMHSTIVPMAMLTVGFGFAPPLVLSLALIWLAHIGFDRALGYGLKYPGRIRLHPSRPDRPGREGLTWVLTPIIQCHSGTVRLRIDTMIMRLQHQPQENCEISVSADSCSHPGMTPATSVTSPRP